MAQAPESNVPHTSYPGPRTRVALVHDYLNQYGGAERVLEELHALYPEAPVYTSMYWPARMSKIIRSLDVRTSFMQRLEAQPGITGLWQVSGRSELGFSEQVVLDIMYIENWSLGLDLRIMLRTLPAVLIGTGAF